MPHTLRDSKAEILRTRATRISSAMQIMDNSELDLAPEVNRVALSGASLPGFAEGTFSGHAEYGRDGKVISVGVRQRGKTECVDLLIKQESSFTRVTEHRYFQGHAITLTVTALFSIAGDLVSYQEIF